MLSDPTRPGSVRFVSGEIDFDFHRRNAAALRREAMQAFPAAKAAAAIACMLALLLGAVDSAHAQRGGGSYSQKGGVAKSDPPPQARDHRGPRGRPGGGVQVRPTCKKPHCHVHW